MIASIQAVFNRWKTLVWGVRGALPESGHEPEMDAAIFESELSDAEGASPQESEAPENTSDPEEQRAALAEIVMRPVDVPSFVLAPGDVEVALRRERTLTALEGLKQIPALQSLAKGFVEAATREDVDLDEVLQAIGKDPSLCVRVSRMANSAEIGIAAGVEDLRQAVQLLGVIRVRTLARALYTLRDSRSLAPGFDWRHLWIHALATAALAVEIERRLRLPADPLLYLAALLHDVGKIVLSVACPDEYAAVLVAAWNRAQPLDALERWQLGVSHREAGEVFLERSGLPGAVISTALFHHAPGDAPESHRLQAAVVALANHLSKTYGLGFSGAVPADGTEGEFSGLPAWKVLETETGRTFDREGFEEEIGRTIPGLKVELRNLRAMSD